jgi:hypothetical protein
MWITSGRRFHVKLAQFARIPGLSSQLDIPDSWVVFSARRPQEASLWTGHDA